MKISLASLASSFEYARTNEWSVSFGENSPNLWKAGGDTGDIFPAVSVEEPLYQAEVENLSLPDGFTIPFPKPIFYGGNLTVEFYDTSKHDLHIFFTKWAMGVHGLDVSMETVEQRAKTIHVARFQPTSGTPIYTNSYMVLPPSGLKGSGDAEVSLLTNRVEFPIVKVLKKQGL